MSYAIQLFLLGGFTTIYVKLRRRGGFAGGHLDIQTTSVTPVNDARTGDVRESNRYSHCYRYIKVEHRGLGRDRFADRRPETVFPVCVHGTRERTWCTRSDVRAIPSLSAWRASWACPPTCGASHRLARGLWVVLTRGRRNQRDARAARGPAPKVLTAPLSLPSVRRVPPRADGGANVYWWWRGRSDSLSRSTWISAEDLSAMAVTLFS